FYEELTEHLGFLRSSDEYKVMALASFGEPRYRDEFRRHVRLGADGDYEVLRRDPSEWLGPRRERGGPLEQHHFDVARSLQEALEETVLGMTRWLHAATGAEHLCLAGGVAL